MIGETLGNRYKILSDLGSGGMAWVYLAEDSINGGLVAVKVLYPQFSLDMAYLQRFVREAKVASALTSPHIVKVLDYGATRDVHYLVMEHIVGQDLRELLNLRHRLPWQEALGIARQVALALDHAFQFGIVHRDIKPQNLMVDQEGTVKVLDFGIARALTMPSLTLTGFVGSPYYISPEQAKGEQVDVRSDIYSLGIVLYEMLTGRIPFNADNPWAIISQHIADTPPPLSEDQADIPQEVSDLVLIALAKPREARFQTPFQLIEAIDAVLSGSAPSLILEKNEQPVSAIDKGIEETYKRGLEAAQAGEWLQAFNFFSYVMDIDTHFRDVKEQVARAETQVKLDDLYTTVLRAIQNKRWEEAVTKLREILSLDANYREASILLDTVESEIEKTLADTPKQLIIDERQPAREKALTDTPKQLTPHEQQFTREKEASQIVLPRASSSRRWLLGALMFVLVGGALLVGGIELVDRQREQITRIRYERAIELFGQKKWEDSIREFDRVLDISPDYKDAASKKQDATKALELEQLYNQGRSQYEAGNLAEAINVLAQLRSLDVVFEQSSVSDMLCDSYYRQATNLSQNVDIKGLQAALALLDKALEICPSHTEILSEKTTLGDYLKIVVDLRDSKWNEVFDQIGALEQTISKESDARLRKILYKAYLSFGQKREEEGNPAAALLHYQKAASVPGVDRSEAERKVSELNEQLVTPTLAPTPQSGSPVALGPTPTSRPTVSPTLSPSPSAEPIAVAGQEKTVRYYSAPKLTAPADATIFTSGRFEKIRLEWEGPEELAEDEYYDVTVLHFFDGKEVYWGTNTKEPFLELSPTIGYGQADKDIFHWFVTIRRAERIDDQGKPDGPPISLRSNAWTFFWR